MKRKLPLLCLLAHARGEDLSPSTSVTIKGLPSYTPSSAIQPTSTSTTATGVTSEPNSEPPLAQPGDLATYGDSRTSDIAIEAATVPPEYSTPKDGFTLPSSVLSSILAGMSNTPTRPTFPLPLRSLMGPKESVITVVTVESKSFITTLWPATTTAGDAVALTAPSTTSDVAVSAAAQEPIASTTPTQATSTPTSTNHPYAVPGLLIGNENLPTFIPLPSASAAISTCATLPGGLRPDGAIDRGCANLFTHITTCFASNGPWGTPYNEARNEAYRACVCMTSDENPFSEYSALWKNFTGCAACVHDQVEFDVLSWVGLETRRMWNFCRAQEPNAFLFTLFLRNWFYRLTDYQDVGGDVQPFTAAFGYRDGMDAMKAAYTGRPPLANIAWGPSAPPDGKYADASPSLSRFATEVRIGDVGVTTAASTLVTWIPTQAGETWNGKAADLSESAAVDRLVESALCLGKGQGYGHCQLNEASKEVLAWPSECIWAFSIAVAVAAGGAALWL